MSTTLLSDGTIITTIEAPHVIHRGDIQYSITVRGNYVDSTALFTQSKQCTMGKGVGRPEGCCVVDIADAVYPVTRDAAAKMLRMWRQKVAQSDGRLILHVNRKPSTMSDSMYCPIYCTKKVGRSNDA